MDHTSPCICVKKKQSAQTASARGVDKYRSKKPAKSAMDLRLERELIWAVESGDVESAIRAINAGADVEARDETGLRTTLGIAATNGNLAIVDALLKAGAKINPSDDDASIVEPLWFAAANGHAGIAKRLIEAGARLDGPRGRNMFLPAIVGGDPKLVSLFLDAGADPDVEFKGWPKPLILASALGHSEIVDLLLAAGANDIETRSEKSSNSVKTVNGPGEEMAVI